MRRSRAKRDADRSRKRQRELNATNGMHVHCWAKACHGAERCKCQCAGCYFRRLREDGTRHG